jgi:hypothetical protein
MRKDGIGDLSCSLPIGPDGAPIFVRLHMTAKPHRAGVVLGNMLAKLSFTPASSDLSTPMLAGFPKDHAALLWGASKFLDAVEDADIAVVGTKVASVKESIKKKFDKTYAKKKEAELKGAKAPPNDHENKLMKEMLAVEYKGKASPATLAIVAQVMSNHGVVGVHGDTFTLCSDPERAKYARKVANANLDNENKVMAALRMYERIASKDKASGESLSTVLAIAGISAGLPIEVGKKVEKEKVDVKAIAKECAKLNEVTTK